MPNDERRIDVKLGGPAVRNGRVPVKLLTKTLDNVQQALVQIGKATIQRDPAQRGPTPDVVQRQCELFLVETKPGSLNAVLELPPQEGLLFPEADVGLTSLGDLRDILDGVVADDPQRVERALPDPEYRKRIVSLVTGMMPSTGADYELQMKIGAAPAPLSLVRPEKARIRAFMATPEPVEPPPTQEAMIDARCRARLTEEGTLENIIEVYDFDVVDAERVWSYRPDEVEWQGRKFRLRHQLACGIDLEEGLWVVNYEPVG